MVSARGFAVNRARKCRSLCPAECATHGGVVGRSNIVGPKRRCRQVHFCLDASASYDPDVNPIPYPRRLSHSLIKIRELKGRLIAIASIFRLQFRTRISIILSRPYRSDEHSLTFPFVAWDMRSRPVDADHLANLLALLGSVGDVDRAAGIEAVIMDTLIATGFDTARWYYQDDNGTLGLERERTKSLEGPSEVIRDETVLPRGGGLSEIASYEVLGHKKPLVVRVDPTCSSLPVVQTDPSGIDFVSIREAPFQGRFGRPSTYEWADFPLMMGGDAFGKITLCKRDGYAISPEDYNTLIVMVPPISTILSTAGWFGGNKLPERIVQKFWEMTSSAQSLRDFFDKVTAHIQFSFNARNCSLFLVHRPEVGDNEIKQREKLVLWSTTYRPLQDRICSAYYDQGEGLTGQVWETEKPTFISDLRSDPNWNQGKFNDSEVHRAWVAAPWFDGNRRVAGVLRIPEGRSHKLLNRESVLLQLYATTMLVPAFNNFLSVRTAEAVNSLNDLLAMHLGDVASDQSDDAKLDRLIWRFAFAACSALFPDDGKSFVAYTYAGKSDSNIMIVGIEGHLERNPAYQTLVSLGGDLPSAVAESLRIGDAILLTDIDSATAQGVYFPLMLDVKSVITVPLDREQSTDSYYELSAEAQSVPQMKRIYGFLSIVSRHYDLLPDRDLRIAKTLAQYCTSLYEIVQLAKRVRRDERSKTLELAAYLVKAPAMTLYTLTKKVRLEIEAARQPQQDSLRLLRTVAVWLHNTVDRILASVHNYTTPIDLKVVCAHNFMCKLTDDLLEFLSSINSKRIKLVYDLSSLFKTVQCSVDYEMMLSAMLSLLDNAKKASPIDGAIALTFDLRETVAGISLVMSIRDQGRGCAPNLLDTLCEMGVHYEYSIGSKELPDTGYGLAVAKRVVSLHGGTIELDSQVGSYFESRLVIPAAKNLME